MSHPAFPGRLDESDPQLSERQRDLFETLVTLYHERARPIGSEALTAHGALALSAASVRAELAELEGAGLLARAHASAGRVPTARGYSYFIRHLITPVALPAEVEDQLQAVLVYSVRDVEHLLQDASRVLASITRQLGLAVADSLERETLTRLDLVEIEGTRVLLVLNVGSTRVRTLTLELESALPQADLEAVAGVLRERLLGRTLREVRERLEHDPELVRHSAVRLVARAARDSWSQPVSTPLMTSGAMHIAQQPEFSTGVRVGSLLQAVESGSPLDRLLVGSIEGQVAVRVGLDEDHALAGCSLVSYVLPGSVPGAVGVLGPLRMDYAFALAVVDAVGTRVADRLA